MFGSNPIATNSVEPMPKPPSARASRARRIRADDNDVGPAISNGAIAAGWGAEPVPSQFEKQGLVKNLYNDAMRGRGAIVFLANAGFAKEHPDAASTFLAVFLKTAREFDAKGWDEPQSLEIVARWFGSGSLARASTGIGHGGERLQREHEQHKGETRASAYAPIRAAIRKAMGWRNLAARWRPPPPLLRS